MYSIRDAAQLLGHDDLKIMACDDNKKNNMEEQYQFPLKKQKKEVHFCPYVVVIAETHYEEEEEQSDSSCDDVDMEEEVNDKCHQDATRASPVHSMPSSSSLSQQQQQQQQKDELRRRKRKNMLMMKQRKRNLNRQKRHEQMQRRLKNVQRDMQQYKLAPQILEKLFSLRQSILQQESIPQMDRIQLYQIIQHCSVHFRGLEMELLGSLARQERAMRKEMMWKQIQLIQQTMRRDEESTMFTSSSSWLADNQAELIRMTSEALSQSSVRWARLIADCDADYVKHHVCCSQSSSAKSLLEKTQQSPSLS